MLEFWQGTRSNGLLWLAAACLIYAAGKAMIKKPAPIKDMPESILSEEQKEMMRNHQKPVLYVPGLALKSKEEVRWTDTARVDFYDGKQDRMVLTNQRILFLHPDFRFEHPLIRAEIKKNKRGFDLKVNGRTMKFITASTPEFFAVLEDIRKER